MNLGRRQLFLASGLLGCGAYLNHRGLRFPRLSFEPQALPNETSNDLAEWVLDKLIFIGSDNPELSNLRAYCPNPTLKLHSNVDSIKITVNNIASAAQLQLSGDASAIVHEEQRGITRSLEINNAQNKRLHIEWRLPSEEGIDFAVIGDTGGGDELEWCIQRAHQLNAQFLLHLGDFNYAPGEYVRAIKQFHQAPMPIYVSIGNHDFNDSGLVYPHFRNEIGPLNSDFTIAGTQFINLDTAASRLPAWSGNRGRLVRALIDSPEAVNDKLVFTHKPFIDTRSGGSHTMSGPGEIPWMEDTMHALGADTLLCGHVHRSTEVQHDTIRQFTAGEGLGFEDIRGQEKVAKILLGSAQPETKIKFEWQALDMPWAAHTSPTHLQKLKKKGLSKQQQWYQQLL